MGCCSASPSPPSTASCRTLFFTITLTMEVSTWGSEGLGGLREDPTPTTPSCFPRGAPAGPWGPGSPLRCGWPRCWDRLQAGSPRRSEGTLGLALHHSHPPPLKKKKKHEFRKFSFFFLLNLKYYFQISQHFPASIQKILKLPSAAGVETPASAAEAAVALRASSSCRCRCSSIETRRA
uniref:Uncharacterized protein n=1 Tax=Poecilia reticulata TaxID=8081 RepID=A0A3P9Q6E5_POERE